jgi:3',5'-cyclic AMP phosphodiesterase CpdA
MPGPSLLAVSDLHVSHQGNAEIVEAIRPEHEDDWIIVAGDVADKVADIRDALAMLRQRFARVLWAPGNHELWTRPDDPVQLRGQARYEHLVELCRDLGVDTPEDPYPSWDGPGGPVAVVPLFLLYDYSWRWPGSTLDTAMDYARDSGVVATDEWLLHPDPYPTRAHWCRHRVQTTLARLGALPADLPTVLASHWPLHRGPTRMLRYQQFAMWCGTDLTADWHQRFRAVAAVSGHLHIPLTLDFDGVRFEEVSLGYPREWQAHGTPRPVRRILPADPTRTPSNALLERVAAQREREFNPTPGEPSRP